MIRILHIVTYMGRGGLETMLMNYYRNIDRTKMQFDFLVHRDFVADYDDEIQSLGGRIYRLPRLNPMSRSYLQQLDNFFATHKEYQIVHSHLDCMAGIPLIYAKQHGIPVRIAHAHSNSQEKDKKYLLKLLYKSNIARNATDLFACGQEAGAWMFHTDDFMILNNAINSQEYVYDEIKRRDIREELHISKESFVVGHVGRFFPVKNHRFIIEIFAELLKRNNQSMLLLVGDGDLKEQIENQAQQLGIKDHIIFTGIRSDVPALLQGMDCFLFPSLHEGLPVSIIEAQAAGLPCYISDAVPIECKKTHLVEQIPLSFSAKEWADRIFQSRRLEREHTSDLIIDAGFDIKENAQWLQKYYVNKLEENVNKGN